MMSRDIIVGIGIIRNSISFRKPSDCKQTVDTQVLQKARNKYFSKFEILFCHLGVSMRHGPA